MAAAGDYPDRVQRLVYSTSTSETGQPVATYTPGGYLWCRITETAGRNQEDHGAEQSGAFADIFVRNYPVLNAVDRLLDSYGQVWLIDSLRQGDNEMICDAYRNDVLDLGGIP